jgi:tetratricopeptide (TPR) repeat protein
VIRFVVGLAIMLVSVAARAEAPAVAKARAHFEAGTKLYEAGSYEEALRAYQTGYAIAARPAFLINIGQCLRALKRPREARAAFAKFLIDAPSKDPHRRGVEEMVAELDREIAQLPPTPAMAPSATAPTVTAPPREVEPPPVQPSGPILGDVRMPQPQPRRRVSAAAWAVPLAIVAAVGLGVGLTANACRGDICVDAAR